MRSDVVKALVVHLSLRLRAEIGKQKVNGKIGFWSGSLTSAITPIED